MAVLGAAGAERRRVRTGPWRQSHGCHLAKTLLQRQQLQDRKGLLRLGCWGAAMQLQTGPAMQLACLRQFLDFAGLMHWADGPHVLSFVAL